MYSSLITNCTAFHGTSIKFAWNKSYNSFDEQISLSKVTYAATDFDFLLLNITVSPTALQHEINIGQHETPLRHSHNSGAHFRHMRALCRSHLTQLTPSYTHWKTDVQMYFHIHIPSTGKFLFYTPTTPATLLPTFHFITHFWQYHSLIFWEYSARIDCFSSRPCQEITRS